MRDKIAIQADFFNGRYAQTLDKYSRPTTVLARRKLACWLFNLPLTNECGLAAPRFLPSPLSRPPTNPSTSLPPCGANYWLTTVRHPRKNSLRGCEPFFPVNDFQSDVSLREKEGTRSRVRPWEKVMSTPRRDVVKCTIITHTSILPFDSLSRKKPKPIDIVWGLWSKKV